LENVDINHVFHGLIVAWEATPGKWNLSRKLPRIQ
jgi:hypothetical protein